MLHAGVNQTLAALRSEYWVIQGRSVVQKVIRSCLICINWEGGPFKSPIFAPLPTYVVSKDQPPFTFTGLDYLGALFVKDGLESVKNWICLFTCLNVRAVHLELVEDMSTIGFIQCFRRFIARRGTPSLIISDNGSQLKSGSIVIGEICKTVANSTDFQTYIGNQKTKWKFTREYAPLERGVLRKVNRSNEKGITEGVRNH